MQITNNEHISSDNAPALTAHRFGCLSHFPSANVNLENDTVGTCMMYRALCGVVLRMVLPLFVWYIQCVPEYLQFGKMNKIERLR